MSYISLPYPWLPDLPSIINQDLQSCHREHLEIHAKYGEQGRKTRQTSELISARIIEQWRDPWIHRWMEDPIKCDAIVHWLRQAIYVDIEQPLAEALNFFLSVPVLISYGDVTVALQELTSWQKQIALNLFNHQKNLALDLINEVEDEIRDPEDSDSDGDRGEDIYAATNLTATFHSTSNWSTILRKHLLPRLPLKPNTDKISAKDLEIGHREVGRTIQTMKKIRKSTYRQHTFAMAVATSGLAQTIIELTDRSVYYDKPHQASYSQRFGFGLVLGNVLGHWTPEQWVKEAEESLIENPPAGYNTGNTVRMQSGHDLIEAITSLPNLVSSISNPASIFFLCSEANFQYAWKRWLSWGLDAAGYHVNDVRAQDLFRRTIQYICGQRQNTRQWDRAKKEWNVIIFFIIEWTMELRELIKDVDDENHRPDVLHCSRCAQESPEKRCVQRVEVELNTDPMFVKRWEGVGVTKVPLEERMKPRKGRKASEAAEIVDPTEIGLREIAIRDEEVVRRCGKHIFLLYMNDELQDFVWYNTFSQEPDGTYPRLVHHSQTPLGVQPVLRGGQFDFWQVGQMMPFGARQPSGGHLADHYTFYQGINADTLWGITVLFEQAEMSATILATARAIHPDLVRKIKIQSALCERVGLSSLNLFNCSGYTAPQHRDKDATPSLCAQFLLQAEQKWSEFGFCALQYGYYFQLYANTLWSFNSTLLHGTLLPSERTILRLRGGADSVGTHTTTRERDRRRAERNEHTVNNHNIRERAWTNRG
ncbi:MAG: hypothetical protein NXY57DRAFT_961220 [Lentinula lateritia]|nr:MAG: hypothetical protein NXY57DRAFT_961220 [Lentinula lateritia]